MNFFKKFIKFVGSLPIETNEIDKEIQVFD